MSEYLPPSLTAQLKAILGERGYVDAPAERAPFETDWRDQYHGKAALVLKPAATEEVARIVKVLAQARIGIVPQGGNTSLCGGSVPDGSGSQVVVSLSRMNRVRAVDAENNTMTVEAGCVLAQLQSVAAEHDRLFPLSLAAEGSCEIGGNLSTNAGGTGVLRYGNTRDLVLGLEVVLPDGSLWEGLRGLRKDNTGYDLKHLFIGAEGTLGVITAAVLKLFPRPRRNDSSCTAPRGESTATKAVDIARGRGKSFTTAAVTIPSVPSAPMKSCLVSKPVESLRSAVMPSRISPSGSTTSRPSVSSRVVP